MLRASAIVVFTNEEHPGTIRKQADIRRVSVAVFPDVSLYDDDTEVG